MNEDWINTVIEDFKETVIFETEYEEGMRCHYQDAVNWLRKILERNQELLHQELQKARAEALREIIEVRNDRNKSTRELLDTIDKYQSELDQPTDGMPHPFGNPEGVYPTKH